MHNLLAYAVAVATILFIADHFKPENGISLQSIAAIELPN